MYNIDFEFNVVHIKYRKNVMHYVSVRNAHCSISNQKVEKILEKYWKIWENIGKNIGKIL